MLITIWIIADNTALKYIFRELKKEQNEIEIISKFLPKQLSKEEINNIIDMTIKVPITAYGFLKNFLRTSSQ